MDPPNSKVKTMVEKPQMARRGALGLISIVVVLYAIVYAFSGIRNETNIEINEKAASKEGASKDVKSGSEVGKLNWQQSPVPGNHFFTDQEISYKPNAAPYLVIIGHVFNIASGFKSYEPGTGYHGFIGRDGSRAFVTGEFSEKGFISDLAGLSTAEFAALADWLEFYIKTYEFAGYHYGRFFDTDKKATAEFQEFLHKQDVNKKEARVRESVLSEYPPCNVEWSEAAGTNVWCSSKRWHDETIYRTYFKTIVEQRGEPSGGIERPWVGYPVHFKESAHKEMRCACVQESQLSDPHVSRYEGCGHSNRCNGVTT